jgi:hypothetical protein
LFGFGLVPIMRSGSGLFGPLHFNETWALLMEYMGTHAITELGAYGMETESFSQYTLYAQYLRILQVKAKVSII